MAARTVKPGHNGFQIAAAQSIDPIIAEIVRDTEKTVNGEIKTWEDFLNQKLTTAMERAKRIWQVEMAKGTTEADTFARNRWSAVRLELQQELLKMQDEFLSKFYAKLQAHLGDITDTTTQIGSKADYSRLLQELSLQGMLVLGGSSFLLYVNKRDRNYLTQSWLRELASRAEKVMGVDTVKVRVSEENVDIVGGVIVSDERYTNVLNNSFESRLERFWPVLRDEISNRYFAPVLEESMNGGDAYGR